MRSEVFVRDHTGEVEGFEGVGPGDEVAVSVVGTERVGAEEALLLRVFEAGSLSPRAALSRVRDVLTPSVVGPGSPMGKSKVAEVALLNNAMAPQ